MLLGPTRLLNFRIFSHQHCYLDSTVIRHPRVVLTPGINEALEIDVPPGINVALGIDVGNGKFGKKNKRSTLNERK